MKQPIIRTDRLILRPFELSDAKSVQRLAGDPAVAATTLNIPHPYEDGVAEQWIEGMQKRFEQGKRVEFAVTHIDENYLIGAVGLVLNHLHKHAELGYWIGKPYWDNGYATEAAVSLVRYGFEELNLNRIYAQYFLRNPASGKVLQKIGMQQEGILRQHIYKFGEFEDVHIYAILRTEFLT